MSDSFSAPVHKARQEWLRFKNENLAARLQIAFNSTLDTIDLHGFAEEIEGLAVDYRAVVTLSIDEYQQDKTGGD